LFTQDYVRGLYELAKNIVEHSGTKGEKGQGIITIRAYSDNDKVLETHVFDYGEEGVIPKLIKYTKEKAYNEKIKNVRIKKCYNIDNAFFEENRNYNLKDYIENGKDLEQQKFRHTSHYGINNLYKLLKNNLNGEVYIATKGIIDKERDYFGENAENRTIKRGTHYYFRIPFEPQNFKNITVKPFKQENQIATLGETTSLEFLSKIKVIPTKLKELVEIDLAVEDTLIEITIEDDRISKENVDSIYSSLDKLNDLKDNNTIAINLHNKIDDASILLRFLSYLTFEYRQPFIVYGLDYQNYNDLLTDNKDFHNSRKDYGEAYWHNERSILLFIKTNKDFYFCDILFGQEREEFLFVNKIVNHTFPNTITLLQELDDRKRRTTTNYLEKITSNQNLQSFFYGKSNLLLPFDILLKNKTELFLSNLKTILENELVRDKYNYNSLDEYISNFDGYHISNTHFRIGAKIHSSDFYYAKRLFQNSFYTARLAMMLAIKIKSKIKNSDKVVLVGYEMYSELLLSLVSKFLNNSGFKSIKHFVGIDNEDMLVFKPNEDIFWQNKETELIDNCKAVIIVPIASTGSTAVKIEDAIKNKARKIIKPILKKKFETDKPNKDSFDKKLEDEIDKITFNSGLIFNVISAQDNDKKYNALIQSGQENLIPLKADWYFPETCEYCFGLEKIRNEDDEHEYITDFDEVHKYTRTLFTTDKSYLTPALIFEKPYGKIEKTIGGKTDRIAKSFDDVNFGESLLYKKVIRNNEFYLFSVNSPRFIKKNDQESENKKGEITKWLEELNKEFFDNTKGIKLKSTDRIILLAPCHETNSEFLNLVNERVFNSSATIIHHQTYVDYIENFKLLNKQLFGNETDNTIKVFYIDDNLISGRQFFKIYHLFSDTVGGEKKLCGAILLRDSSSQETHDRFVRIVNNSRVFVSYNLPPSLSFDSKKPLDHERKRYEDLRKFALHDVLIKTFDDKELELNVDEKSKISNYIKGEIDIEKLRNNFPDKYNEFQKLILEKEVCEQEEIKANKDRDERHLKVFEATHKIYDFFAKKNEEDERIRKENDETDTTKKLLFNIENLKIEDLQRECFKKDKSGNDPEYRKSLMKVLTQYPFLLYKPLKEISFEWHKKWLSEKIKDKFNGSFNINSTDKEGKMIVFPIDEFRELKFLLRRGVFLENMLVVDKAFLQLLPLVFNKIKEKLDSKEISNKLPLGKLSALEIRNLNDFQIFLVRNYLELTHKNGWAAVKLLKNLDAIENEFNTNAAKQFLRMLKVELAAVVNDFNNVITTQFEIQWRDIFKNAGNSLDTSNERVIKFFKDRKKDFLTKAKYDIATKVLGRKKYIPLMNYYWIKQLIFNETHPKSYFPKIELQEKIKAMSDKVKGFFPIDKLVETFFIVTDKQNEAYIVHDDNNNLHHFDGIIPISHFETDIDKIRKWEDNKFKTLNRILYGIPDIQGIAVESMKEYRKDTTGNWIDIHTNEKFTRKDEENNFEFLPPDKNYILFIRFSQFKDHNHRILGLMGFYCRDHSFNDNTYLLPKQLLMLLRQDIGEFIIRHHKNDEFSALRAAETVKRFAYLAGHGRQTMQRLAKNDETKIFRNVISTLDKLQYLYAIKNLHSKKLNLRDHERTKNMENEVQSDLIKTFTPIKITGNETIQNTDYKLKEIIQQYIKLIYTSKDIENNVKIAILDTKLDDKVTESDDVDKITELDYDTYGTVNISIKDSFRFNYDILLFIIFELIVNAKKNRWHCIENNNNRCSLCRNFIKIRIVKEEKSNKLEIKIKTTGTKLGDYYNSIGNKVYVRDTINSKRPIKESYQNEGIYLITKILEHLDKDNDIEIKESKEITRDENCHFKDCENPCNKKCQLYANSIEITINQQQYDKKENTGN
jgi:hypothetical protein